MANLTPRYAAFLKRNGRSDFEQSPAAHQHPRPHKPTERASHVLLATDAEAWAAAGSAETEALFSVRKQRPPPFEFPTSPAVVNLKKRPAASDALPADDLRRPDSPVKFSRTSHTRFVSSTAEHRPVHEQLAAFSLSPQPVFPSYDQPRDGSRPDSSGFPSRGGLQAIHQNHLKQPRGLGGLSHALRINTEAPTLSQLRLQELISKSDFQQESSTRVADSDDIDDGDESEELQVNEGLESQPQSRPLTEEQLTTEVKAIYAGLLMIEAKCVNTVNEQNAALAQGRAGPLDAAQWHAMISLHRSLLYEHHDFLMASQHPAAPELLRRLALKHSMPARMWRVGIHNFLELLRRHLPHSLEFMLLFIYHAYQTISLLYETIPAFEDTWIECLGDLSRYRMAIEEEDQSDRDTWTGVARYWYSKASDRNPNIGRLYHHLAVLARSQALQQLSLYCRSLSAVQVFPSARESVMTLFDPVLTRSTSAGSRPLSVESWFIRCHALIFTNASLEVGASLNAFAAQFGDHITRMESKWRLQGAYMAVTNIASLLAFGSPSSPLREIFLSREQGPPPPLMDPSRDGLPFPRITRARTSPAWALTFHMFRMVLARTGNEDVLPYIHVMLVFIWRLAMIPYGSDYVNNEIPWLAIATYLNSLQSSEAAVKIMKNTEFPMSEQGDRQPLPEDFFIRGLIWSQDYYPAGWFEEVSAEDERLIESGSMAASRVERVLWLGVQISSCKGWLEYNAATKRFHVNEQFANGSQKGASRSTKSAQQSEPAILRASNAS